ncbi:hypothetical protein CN481_04440 [Bacillus sp. AFS006103]|nr:hypothetical protein CN481_04440 [Bacillus sp. AFS006103]
MAWNVSEPFLYSCLKEAVHSKGLDITDTLNNEIQLLTILKIWLTFNMRFIIMMVVNITNSSFRRIKNET